MAIGGAEQLECAYSDTTCVPVYVMLPLGTIGVDNTVAEPEKLRQELATLKRVGTDGVMVDCWWGIVEVEPQVYCWSAYRQLFTIVREAMLKLQVVMSFHQCGGNVGDDVFIPLPQWVLSVGRENPDIFFTNRQGCRNSECLTFGIDDEPVLNDRTALEVYFDFMQSFREEFREFFEDGNITEIEVGMGPCGELRYPSYPETQGWRYPGTGEFQCWDKYLLKSLKKAADDEERPEWAVGPSDAGDYNCGPEDSDFFRGGYNSDYGEFFLTWYSQSLIQHGDNVLTVASQALGPNMKLAAKVSGIHWWYKTASHAAELAAGFYNQRSRCGYSAIASMLATHKATFNFTCIELRTADQAALFPEAQADPESLVTQVLQAAWAQGVEVACENALPCYTRTGYDQIISQAKSKGYCNHSLAAFTYLRLNSQLMEEQNLTEFMRFVHQLHGKSMPSFLREGERLDTTTLIACY